LTAIGGKLGVTQINMSKHSEQLDGRNITAKLNIGNGRQVNQSISPVLLTVIGSAMSRESLQPENDEICASAFPSRVSGKNQIEKSAWMSPILKAVAQTWRTGKSKFADKPVEPG
jgi:hypothetical protein